MHLPFVCVLVCVFVCSSLLLFLKVLCCPLLAEATALSVAHHKIFLSAQLTARNRRWPLFQRLSLLSLVFQVRFSDKLHRWQRWTPGRDTHYPQKHTHTPIAIVSIVQLLCSLAFSFSSFSFCFFFRVSIERHSLVLVTRLFN